MGAQNMDVSLYTIILLLSLNTIILLLSLNIIQLVTVFFHSVQFWHFKIISIPFSSNILKQDKKNNSYQGHNSSYLNKRQYKKIDTKTNNNSYQDIHSSYLNKRQNKKKYNNILTRTLIRRIWIRLYINKTYLTKQIYQYSSFPKKLKQMYKQK